MKQVTKHFGWDELACPCCGEMKIAREAVNKLETLRGIVKRALPVSSAYRCFKHNRSLPNASPTSRHVEGVAFDILVSDSIFRFNLINHAMGLGFRGIGVYKNFIHLDLRESAQVVWVGGY